MKCIVKAMNETEYKPRAKWWGYVEGNYRFLCRYNHVFAIFELTKGEEKFARPFREIEKRTDKVGVDFAINYFKENIK